MMLAHPVFAMLLSAYSVLGAPAEPTHSPIVGGQNADKNEYPWQIMLKYDGDFYCGGSIIDENTVLTAAHCVEDDPDQIFGSFSIVAGEYDLSNDENTEKEIDVDTVVVHENYDSWELDNDIAILFLAEPLELCPSVQLVPRLSDKKFDRKAVKSGNCTVSGWGVFDDDTREIPDIMQELTPTNVIGNRGCNKKLKKYGLKVTPKMICTFDKKSGVCNGDSGGPMGCYDDNGDFTQVGIVSWGPSRMCANGRQVFTRVSKYISWIEEEMNLYFRK